MAAMASLSLNCSDLPEAEYWASKAKAEQRQVSSKGKQGKSRLKSVGLPVLLEISEQEVDEERSYQSPWQCRACRHVNNELLSRCEICDSEAGKDVEKVVAQGAVVEVAKVPLMQSIPSQDWPSLPEAWLDCDVSSMASSWLDIGTANDLDEEADIVIVSESTLQAPAKPLLWSAVVGRSTAAAAVPAAEVAVPPLLRKPLVRASKMFQQETPDDALDILEARRMPARPHRVMRRR